MAKTKIFLREIIIIIVIIIILIYRKLESVGPVQLKIKLLLPEF